MSQTTKTGRHTPLSLNPSGKSKKTRNLESTTITTTSTTTILQSATSVVQPMVSLPNEKTIVAKEKESSEISKSTTKMTNVQQQNVQQQNKKKSNDKEEVTPTKVKPQSEKLEKSTSINSLKQVKQSENVDKVKKNENGTSTDNSFDEKESNGSQKVEEATDEKKIRESPRQKALKESDGKNNDDVEAGKKKEIFVDLTKDIIVTQKKNKNDTLSVLNPVENTKKDISFTSDAEMDALLMSVDLETGKINSPMPKTQQQLSTKLSPGRILKLGSGPPQPTRSLDSFRRSDRLQNASTIVNLSTVSEMSAEVGNISPEKTTFSAGLRTISGRKSLRPLREMTFQNNSYRETYRKINDSFSSTSMNATVGSEIHNDSVRTPILTNFGQRKRDRFEEYKIEQVIETDCSPKRRRLDLSGFLGIITSPVIMLKDKLQRTKLQSSTPNSKKQEDIIIDTVSASDIDVETIEEEEDKEIDDLSKDMIEDNNEIEINIDGKLIDVPMESNEQLIVSSETISKKKWCVIM